MARHGVSRPQGTIERQPPPVHDRADPALGKILHRNPIIAMIRAGQVNMTAPLTNTSRRANQSPAFPQDQAVAMPAAQGARARSSPPG